MLKKRVMIFLGCLIFYISSSFAWHDAAPQSNILIFVSFSMPKESLRQWLLQADLIKAPVLIRGLVHHSFRETTKAVMEIVSREHGGVLLDPLLFRKFNIEKVPAVVVTDTKCLKEEVQKKCETFDVIYGNVTLEYALKEIARQEDALSLYARSALKQLTKNHHAS